MIRRLVAFAWVLAACVTVGAWPVQASETVVARRGKTDLRIVVSPDADPAEQTAAEELSRYLRRATGARFRIVKDKPRKRGLKGIHVGRTRRAAELGVDMESLDAEAWRLVVRDGNVVVAGGRPRGTLYAAYRFLEDQVGVRWWTPWDDSVPDRPDLVLPEIERSGRPAFIYRDVNGAPGPRSFWARNRVNGHFTFLPTELGGRLAYGPPDQVHNFYRYVPPAEHFERHPEYYSELDGKRTAERAQLCLSNEALARLVADRLRGYIEQARGQAIADGEEPALLFDISQNDWSGACQCARCRAMEQREGSASGALVEFINRVAATIDEDYPDVLVDTLAYGFSFAPPRNGRFRENVVVRVAPLYDRDFSRPVNAQGNRSIREAIERWSKRTDHLRVWDYTVTYGPHAQLPLPNLHVIAENLRFYRQQGVEGIFVQHSHPVLSDMRDLKLWLLTKLMEDPQREVEALVTEFTDGYYGPAGETMRDYLGQLKLAAISRPARIGYPAEPEAFGYLDEAFLFRAHELFDLAQRSVAQDRVLASRVRRARIALDRGTVLRWESVFGKRLVVSDDAGRTLRVRSIAERCRATVHATIEERIPERRRSAARDRIDRELGAVAEQLTGIEH